MGVVSRKSTITKNYFAKLAYTTHSRKYRPEKTRLYGSGRDVYARFYTGGDPRISPLKFYNYTCTININILYMNTVPRFELSPPIQFPSPVKKSCMTPWYVYCTQPYGGKFSLVILYSLTVDVKKSLQQNHSKLSPTVYMTIYKSTNLQEVNIKTLKSSTEVTSSCLFIY